MSRMSSTGLAFFLFLGAAAPLGAHPHIFVDTALRLVIDESGQATAVEVTWRYDDFYSLLILQDRGLDMDADGALTEAELPEIQKWDLAWMEGYAGDLYVKDAAGGDVALGPPEDLGTTVTDGRIESRHRRALGPVAADGLVLRAYDPEFYTAYDLTLGVTATAGDCSADVVRPEEDDSYREAEAIMAEFPEDAMEVPLLGHLFAETVTIACAAGN